MLGWGPHASPCPWDPVGVTWRDLSLAAKPEAIHEPLVFCERLAAGPRRLLWSSTLRPEELKAELRKAKAA